MPNTHSVGQAAADYFDRFRNANLSGLGERFVPPETLERLRATPTWQKVLPTPGVAAFRGAGVARTAATANAIRAARAPSAAGGATVHAVGRSAVSAAPVVTRPGAVATRGGALRGSALLGGAVVTAAGVASFTHNEGRARVAAGEADYLRAATSAHAAGLDPSDPALRPSSSGGGAQPGFFSQLGEGVGDAAKFTGVGLGIALVAVAVIAALAFLPASKRGR